MHVYCYKKVLLSGLVSAFDEWKNVYKIKIESYEVFKVWFPFLYIFRFNGVTLHIWKISFLKRILNLNRFFWYICQFWLCKYGKSHFGKDLQYWLLNCFNWNLYLYFACACLLIRQYPINATTAVLIGSKFRVGPHMIPGDVYVFSKLQKYVK